jgi:hypothetical protein
MNKINWDIEKLKINFNGYQDIEANYSQAYQDLFVLTILNGKKGGVYIEIGGSDPIQINNTYLLEKKFGWKGLSFEWDSSLVDKYNSTRSNKCLCVDATKVDYTKEFMENNLPKQIDYLQVDIEPATQTLQALKQLDLNIYRFTVITFETDAYANDGMIIKESREIFKHYGYQLVASNVKYQRNVFEDWYVDPTIVSAETWQKFICNNTESQIVIFKSTILDRLIDFSYTIYRYLTKYFKKVFI